ncbi:MAG TPA: tetratricopeptide repeat protein, partial [Pirellulales bacterium]|nr:tetratricopeptide repeat protein [Pirellulales bacterium]
SPQLETNLREVLRIDPGHLTARLMLVDYLLSAKRVAEAQQECETCRKQAPDDPRVGIELGLYHFQMGQMGEARREIEGAIERVSDANLGMQGLITLGQIAAAEQDWQRAVEHYTRAVHLRPFDGVATYSLGTALSKLGKGDEAAKYVERYKLLAKQNEEIAEINGALVKDTANVDLRIKMAGILFEQGRKADAATWMLSALRYDPQRREAHELLAEFYEEAGKLELAQQHRDAARAGSSSSSSQESAANSVP